MSKRYCKISSPKDFKYSMLDLAHKNKSSTWTKEPFMKNMHCKLKCDMESKLYQESSPPLFSVFPFNRWLSFCNDCLRSNDHTMLAIFLSYTTLQSTITLCQERLCRNHTNFDIWYLNESEAVRSMFQWINKCLWHTVIYQ